MNSHYNIQRVRKSADKFGAIVQEDEFDYLLDGLENPRLTKFINWKLDTGNTDISGEFVWDWICAVWPPIAYNDIPGWVALDQDTRRALLVEAGLAYTEQEEFWLTLTSDHNGTVYPV